MDITDLIIGLSRGQFDATPMQAQIDEITSLLQTMKVKVFQHHDEDQKLLNDSAAVLVICDDQRDSSNTSALLKKASYEAHSTAHKSCRETEAVLWTTKKTCEDNWKEA